MSITTVMKNIELNNSWYQITDAHTNKRNSAYVIAVKNKMQKFDTLDSEQVETISFAVGIDSGIKDKPITIATFTLNFNDETSEDERLNKRTAFKHICNLPTSYYLKATQIMMKGKWLVGEYENSEEVSGERRSLYNAGELVDDKILKASIEININPVAMN